MIVGSQAPCRLHTVLKQYSISCTVAPQLHSKPLAVAHTQALPSERSQHHFCGTRLHKLAGRSATRCLSASTETAELIEQKNAENDVVIYSKSYCPFSGQVKQLFKKLNVEYKAFELDEIVEGDDVLDSLLEKTSSRTVPQIFIKGQYIGGCSETLSKFRSGKLKDIFEGANIAAKF